jgi:hypothetical protein
MCEKQIDTVIPEIFDVLKHSNDKRKKAVLDKYDTRESIARCFIVRWEKRNKFLVFRNAEEFNKFQLSQKEEDRNFHEVIFNWMRQKLRFDLDYTGTKEDENQVSLDLDEIINSICAVFYTHYNYDIQTEEIIVFDSSGPTGDSAFKYSYHIIIDGYYVNDNVEAAAFANHVIESLSPTAKKMVDIGVYKQLQFMRMYGSCKLGSKRTKLIYGDKDFNNEMFRKSLITNTIGCIELPSISNNLYETEYASHELLTDDTNVILDIIKEHTKGHKYRRTIGSRIEFQRLYPTDCGFCGEWHHNDNTLIFDTSYFDTTQSYAIYMKCRHAPGKSNYVGDYKNAGDIEKATGNLPALILARELQEKKTNTHPDDIYPKGFIKSKFDELEYASKNVYSSEKLCPFEFTPTLCVRAQMKMGKTKALSNYIDKNFNINSDVAPFSAVFISFRQTFSSEIKAKFPEFTLYSDVEGSLKQSKLIVQVESLHRLQFNTPFDLLVMDESEAIFEQFSSGLQNHHGKSWGVFQWLMEHSKHVVAMDANLGDRTYNMLKIMRPKQPIFYHCNVYQNDVGSNYHFTADKAEWLYILYHTLDNNERVVIPASSLREAETIHKTISERYPKKRVGCYTSKTPLSEKRRHFSDVNTYWSTYDVLIYTPTVSAGVSFELAHYDTMFCYFIDKSCTVETCLQMMGRIRNIKTRNIHLCINSTFNNLPTTSDDIKRFMLNKRANLMHKFDDTFIRYEYDANGKISVCEDAYLTCWVENQRIANLSRNKFASRFINYLRSYGGTIKKLDVVELTNANPEQIAIDIGDIANEHKANKTGIVEKEASLIANSRDITADEADEIREQFKDLNSDNNAAEDVCEEARYEYEKYKLRDLYNWNDAIDTAFVKSYQDPRIKQLHINLRQICNGTDCKNALINIQRRENETLKSLMDSEESHYANILPRIVFDKHRCAIVLLLLCGFTGLFDKLTISGTRLYQNLKKRHDDIVQFNDIVANGMGLYIPNLHIKHLPPDQYTHKIVQFINRVLRHMYGFSILEKENIYSIHEFAKFEYIHKDDENKMRAEKIKLTKPAIHVYCGMREFNRFDDEDVVDGDAIGGDVVDEDNIDNNAIDTNEYVDDLLDGI